MCNRARLRHHGLPRAARLRVVVGAIEAKVATHANRSAFPRRRSVCALRHGLCMGICVRALSLASALVVLGVLVPSSVRAVDTTGAASAWSTRRLAVDGHLGVGTPYGVAGLSLDVSPIQYWTIGVGGGVSFHGPQLALSTRGRYPFGDTGVKNNAFALGGGVSRGPYESCGGDSRFPWGCFDVLSVRDWDAAYWLQFEGSYEHRWAGGAQFRLYGGAEWLLNPAARQCHAVGDARGCTPPSPSASETHAYVGIAVGYAFTL